MGVNKFNFNFKIPVFKSQLADTLPGLIFSLFTLFSVTVQTGRTRVRFPMVSLEFFSDVIFLVALWPWGGLSL